FGQSVQERRALLFLGLCGGYAALQLDQRKDRQRGQLLQSFEAHRNCRLNIAYSDRNAGIQDPQQSETPSLWKDDLLALCRSPWRANVPQVRNELGGGHLRLRAHRPDAAALRNLDIDAGSGRDFL